MCLHYLLPPSSSRPTRVRAGKPVFADQLVGVRQETDRIWLVSFMHYDLGYFDDDTCRLEPIQNPFGPALSPVSRE